MLTFINTHILVKKIFKGVFVGLARDEELRLPSQVISSITDRPLWTGPLPGRRAGALGWLASFLLHLKILGKSEIGSWSIRKGRNQQKATKEASQQTCHSQPARTPKWRLLPSIESITLSWFGGGSRLNRPASYPGLEKGNPRGMQDACMPFLSLELRGAWSGAATGWPPAFPSFLRFPFDPVTEKTGPGTF